ncbi:MAG: hypothetical protein J6S83_00195 [Lachnospiraceae bacterium]|nr:hypothetical protein [Lachnospiraceae bacterium]
MSMLVIFDHHKKQILEDLKAARDAGQIRQTVSDHFDRMLVEHNEALSASDAGSDRAQLGLAAALVALAKASVRFLDSTGEPVIWEKRSSASSQPGTSEHAGSFRSLPRLSKIGIGLSGAGLLIFWLFLILKLLSPASLSAALQMVLPALLMTALCALGVWLLIRGARISDPADRQYMAEITYDREKILGHMRALVITIDQCMDDMKPLLDGSGDYDEETDASGLKEDELRLLSDLLEAGCSKDGQIALESISRVRYYLHRKGIEVVDYSADKRRWFEMMPSADDTLSGNAPENAPLSDADRTLRPALVRDETVLRKGLAY